MRGWAQRHAAGPGEGGEVGLTQGPLCRGEGGGREGTCSLLRKEMISGKCWSPELAQGLQPGDSVERWFPDGEGGPQPAREEEEREEEEG